MTHEEAGGAGTPRQPAGHDVDRFFLPHCPPNLPMVGRSKAVQRTLATIQAVAKSHLSPVLILGETGTGKELAAMAVHALRGGDDTNFVAINCATLTAHLLESELFGHMRGAFTGADREKDGLFELAGSGTIFLDEISEMPVNLQAKLLRVLQERKFRKVGGTKDILCRATVIASSNRDLSKESRAGAFRPDLYYRLAVLPIALAPLRHPERRDDILLLAEHFIATLGDPNRTTARTLSREALELLLRHDWPGNVRELRNAIERALILESRPIISPESLVLDGHLPDPPAAGPEALAGDLSLETAERLFITRALQETGWQRTRAAALLGITRATLHAKLKRYKIMSPDLDDDADAPSAEPPAKAQDDAPAETRLTEASY